MSDYLKKHLTTQLELLDESSFYLQSSISDFVQQITTIAKKSVNNTSDTNMTVKYAITMVTKAQSALHEHIHLLTELTEKETRRESLKQTQAENISNTFLAESNTDAMRRLTDIEKCLSSLQDAKQKTENEISEIKQWRDNFVTEQINNGNLVEKLSKKQKQNFENIKKQIHEQGNKIEKLFEDIECIKQKEAISEESIVKTSLDLKDYKCSLDKINALINGLTVKVETFSQEIRSHSDLTSTIQEDGKKNKMNTTSSRGKLPSKDLTEKVEPYSRGIRSLSDLTSTIQEDGKKNTICTTSSRGKLPFKGPTEKVEPYSREIRSHSDLTSTIQEDGKKNTIYTTSSRRKFPSKTETKEKAVLKVSQDITKMSNQQVTFLSPLFIASQGCWDGKTCNGFNVIIFSDVETNEGNHFDPKIGVFTAPVYGLYEASLTIKQTGDRAVKVGVRRRSGGVVSRLGDVWTTEKSVEASRTFEVPMKAGDVLYLTSSYSACECTHFSCSRLFSE